MVKWSGLVGESQCINMGIKWKNSAGGKIMSPLSLGMRRNMQWFRKVVLPPYMTVMENICFYCIVNIFRRWQKILQDKMELRCFHREIIGHFLLSSFHVFYIFCLKEAIILPNVQFNIKHVNKNSEFHAKVWFKFCSSKYFFLHYVSPSLPCQQCCLFSIELKT